MAKKTYFNSLDSLRGIAAIAVAWYHYRPNWGGYLAVDFFLVLSGFVLSHSYLYGKRLDFGSFLVSRLARLYPLHIYALVIYIIVRLLGTGTLPEYPDGNLFTLMQNLFLIQNVGLNPNGLTWNNPSWSISVEFWVNVLFFILIRKTTKNLWMITISALCMTILFINTGHLETQYVNYFYVINSGLIRGVGSFLIGIVAYRVWKNIGSIEFKRERLLFTCLEVVTLAAVLIILFWRESKVSSLDFAMPPAAFLVVVVYGLEKGLVSYFIKPFKYTGTISYSIYLNHFTVLLVVNRLLSSISGNPLIFLTVYTAVVLIYSHFTYKFIEMPLRHKLKNWLSTSLRRLATDSICGGNHTGPRRQQ